MTGRWCAVGSEASPGGCWPGERLGPRWTTCGMCGGWLVPVSFRRRVPSGKHGRRQTARERRAVRRRALQRRVPWWDEDTESYDWPLVAS